MNKQVNYTWVGVFVLGLIALLIAFAFWLSATSRHPGYDRYQIHAKADVSGLHVNSVVRFSGVKVGSVTAVEIDAQDAQAVLLTVEVASHIPITTSTVASLKNEGITGVQYVALKAKKAVAPKLIKHSSNHLPMIAFEPSVFSQLSDSMSDILVNVDKVTQKMTTVLTMTEELMPDVQRVVHHLDAVGENMADVTDQMRQNPAVILRGRKPAALGPGEG